MPDHVHLFVSCPPDYSVRKLDQQNTKAVAAYNFCEGNISKYINRAEANGWNWIDILPTKVRKYVLTALDDRPLMIEPIEIYISFEGSETHR